MFRVSNVHYNTIQVNQINWTITNNPLNRFVIHRNLLALKLIEKHRPLNCIQKIWSYDLFGGLRMCLLSCKYSLYLKGSSESSVSYWSRRVLARKKITPDATRRNPATDAMAMPTTNGSDTYSSQCSPRYHQFSPTRHLKQDAWHKGWWISF